MSAAITLDLAAVPVSANRLLHAHWRVVHRHKTRLQAHLEALLMAANLPRPLGAGVLATAELRFPTRRRRDEGNYRAPLEKALGDALVNGAWLADDVASCFRFGVVQFDPEPGLHRTLITLRPLSVGGAS